MTCPTAISFSTTTFFSSFNLKGISNSLLVGSWMLIWEVAPSEIMYLIANNRQNNTNASKTVSFQHKDTLRKHNAVKAKLYDLVIIFGIIWNLFGTVCEFVGFFAWNNCSDSQIFVLSGQIEFDNHGWQSLQNFQLYPFKI